MENNNERNLNTIIKNNNEWILNTIIKPYIYIYLIYLIFLNFKVIT